MRILAIYGVLIIIPTLFLFISELETIYSTLFGQYYKDCEKPISHHKLSPIINSQDSKNDRPSYQQQTNPHYQQSNIKQISKIWAIVSGSIFACSSLCFWIIKYIKRLTINDTVFKFEKFHASNFFLLLLYLLLPLLQLILKVVQFFSSEKFTINNQADACIAIIYAFSIIYGNQFLVVAIDALRNALQQIERRKLLKQLKDRQQTNQKRLRQRALAKNQKFKNQQLENEIINISEQPLNQLAIRPQFRNSYVSLNFTEAQYQDYYTKAVLITIINVLGFCVFLVLAFSHNSCVFLGTLLSIIVYHTFTLEERASRMINISWLAVWGIPLSIFLAYCLDFYEKQCYRLLFYLIGYNSDEQNKIHGLNPTRKNISLQIYKPAKQPFCFFEFSDHLCALLLIYLFILNIKKMVRTAGYIRRNSAIRQQRIQKASKDKYFLLKFEDLAQKIKEKQLTQQRKGNEIIKEQYIQISCMNPQQQMIQQQMKKNERSEQESQIESKQISSQYSNFQKRFECSICCNDQERAAKGNLFIPLKCGHSFHENCLRDWFKQKISCPNCRQTNNRIL